MAATTHPHKPFLNTQDCTQPHIKTTFCAQSQSLHRQHTWQLLPTPFHTHCHQCQSLQMQHTLRLPPTLHLTHSQHAVCRMSMLTHCWHTCQQLAMWKQFTLACLAVVTALKSQLAWCWEKQLMEGSWRPALGACWSMLQCKAVGTLLESRVPTTLRLVFMAPNCTLLMKTLHNAMCYFWLALLTCAAMCTKLNFDALRIQKAKPIWLLWHSELIMQDFRPVQIHSSALSILICGAAALCL